jgi:hypothetical protein
LASAGTLTGSELVPVIQGSATKRTTINDLVRVRRQWIDPRDHGCACDGVRDDSNGWDAVNVYIGDTTAFRVAEIHLPGPSAISRRLLFERKAITMVGKGWAGQRAAGRGLDSGFVAHPSWASKTDALLEGRQAYGWDLQRMRFTGRTAADRRPFAAVRMHQPDPSTQAQPNSRNTWRHICFGRVLGYDDASNYGFANGLLLDGTVNINNDQNLVEDCTFAQCETGLNVAITQAGTSEGHNLRFDQCGTSFKTVAQWYLRNCLFSSSRVRDLDVNNTHVIADEFTSEDSAQMAFLTDSAQLFVRGYGFEISNSLTGSSAAGTTRVIDMTSAIGHPVLELADFTFQGGAYTNPGTPKLGIVQSFAGGVKRRLGLFDVRWRFGEGIQPFHLEATVPAGGSDELLIHGYVRGTVLNSVHRPIYNQLDAANPTPDWSRNDTLRSGLAPVRTKAGPPTDADFPFPPADGVLVVDSSNHRLYVRSGGTWRSTPLT